MGARSRSGCLSCRRRKKKCDEEKPICTACLRNNLACVWPGPSTQGEAASRLQMLDHPVTESGAWTASVDAHPNWPNRRIPLSPPFFVLPGSVLSVSETWKLLDHYLKDTANRLACLQDNKNPFLHTILPAALQDELLMNSILALSGVHLMQRNPSLNQKIQTLTWSSYTRALKQLRVALSTAFGAGNDHNNNTIWRMLLVVLIFYLLEVGPMILLLFEDVLIHLQATRGTDPKAMQRHLDGAHHLMAYLMRSGLGLAESDMVSLTTELYVYNASLASFTTNYTPTSPTSSSMFASFPIRNTGVMCGCAYELFIHVPKVSALLWSLASHDAIPEKHLISEYEDLRVRIKGWKPNSAEQDMVVCAELYQQSLLLLLDCHFAVDEARSSIDYAFQNLECILSRLPPASPMSTTATWPLFAFGLVARHERFREMIRSYLRSLVDIFGMGVMSTALTQLEEIWKDNQGQDVMSTFFMNQSNLPLIC